MALSKRTRRLAMEALERWIQTMAFDANLYERGVDTFRGETASKMRKKLRAALEELRQDGQS